EQSTGRIVKVKHKYEAQGPEQLSFSVGDIVELRDEKVNAKGWGLGKVNGKVGWFPADFVDMQPQQQLERTRAHQPSKPLALAKTRRNSGESSGGMSQGKGAPPLPPYPGRS
ncbi:unnamed protein product, partial [Discosporangium mesarthrocarpum]